MPKRFPLLHALIMVACAVALPWLITIGSINAFELWLPGQVKVDHWRNLSSASFIAGGALGAYAILAANASRIVRVGATAFVVLVSLWFAFMLQLRSKCGDESVYIGEPVARLVESCQ